METVLTRPRVTDTKKHTLQTDPSASAQRVFFIALFVVLTAVNYLTPLTGDDMTFYGLSTTMSLSEIFKYISSYGNGRFLGNLLIMLFVRSAPARAMFKSFIITGTTFLTCRLLELRSLIWLSLTAILVVLPGTDYIARVYTWSAGFMNYVPPVFLLLLCLYIVKIFSGKKFSLSVLFACIGVFIAGFASQLFCENSTVFNIIVALLVLISGITKQKKAPSAVSAAWLLSAVGGATVMYLIPKVIETAADLSWYRNTSFGGIAKFIGTAFGHYATISNRVISCLPIWMVISAALIIYIVTSDRREKIPPFARIMCQSVLAIYPIFNVMIYLLYNYDGTLSELVRFIETALFTSYLGVVYLVIIKFIPEQRRKTALTLVTAAMVSLLPLLVVSPIGTRTVYLGYSVMVLFALYLAEDAFTSVCPASVVRFLGKALCMTLGVCCAVLFISYLEVATVNEQRTEYIKAEIEDGSKRVVIPALPHNNLIYDGEKCYCSSEGVYEGLPAMFYDEEPGDVRFKVFSGSFSEWQSKYQKNSDDE